MDKFIGWWKADKRYIALLKACLAALLPLIGCLVYCAMQGKTMGQVYLPASEWNDELFYFKQVESMVQFGYPKGYFGFNESHALKLSYAAWSPVLVFPWVLWGVVFGWNMLSPVICNLVIMTLAVFFFMWLVRPTWKQLGIFTLLFFLHTPFVRYIMSGMPEVICFGLLVLFYGLAISWLRKPGRGKLIGMFVISSLLLLMRPYMILFLLLPMAFLIAQKKWKGVGISLIILGVVGVTYALIKHYFGAEYFAPLFFTDWITAFFEQGIVGGFHYFFSKLYWNGLDFIHHVNAGIKVGLASGAFFSGYLVMMAVLLVQSVIDFRTWRKDKTNEENRNQLIIEAHLAFSFVGMLFALLLMYKLTEGSKHLLTFMAAGIFIISLLKTKFYKKAVLVGLTCAYFYSYMAVDPYDYQVPFAEEQLVAQVEWWEQNMARELEIVEENVPSYDNAIIWTFSDERAGKSENLKWQLLYGLPDGFGISCCMPDYIVSNFDGLQNRYIATLSDGRIDAMCAEAGYEELIRDQDMVVYRRY